MFKNLSNKERLSVLVINIIIAYLVYMLTSNRWTPTGGLESVWLTCAISYWFLALFSAKWFLAPRDAIISSVGSLLILSTMEIDLQDRFFASELDQLRSVAFIFSLIVVISAIFALLLYDRSERSPWGHFTFKITETFGQGELLFSAPATLSIIATYQNSPSTIVWLLLYWLLIMIGKPVERIWVALRSFADWRAGINNRPTVGSIIRIDYPDIIRVRLNSNSAWHTNRLFTASMPNGEQIYIISLFSQMQETDIVGTGLKISTAQDKINLPNGMVCSSHDEKKTSEFLEKLSGSKDTKLVGFVVENSSIAIITFEVTENSELEEGNVVFCRISGKDIFYQVIGAETSEESFDQNPRGTHIVKAAQLGFYTPSEGFKKYSWLPTMNTAVFSAGSREFEQPSIQDREFAIGKVPSTNVETIVKLDELIEYHTAILGVTGTGKTELALDIVKQAVDNKVKVFCVDFTGEYRERLRTLKPTFPSLTSEQGINFEEKLLAVETGTYGAGSEKKALAELLNSLKENINHQINTFLSGTDQNLAILELAEIANTKASLRITELYLSAIMGWARKNRRVKKILIVLEEAHTIIPETAGSGLDFDTQFVVSRIGQIALQGRKYGVGLIVISQRTALVSKTILSQCNTFFTHSLIDQTSLKFLESVYSTQHARLIPNLGRFEFLASGKAVKAERPIILRRDFDQSKQDASHALDQTTENANEDTEDIKRRIHRTPG